MNIDSTINKLNKVLPRIHMDTFLENFLTETPTYNDIGKIYVKNSKINNQSLKSLITNYLPVHIVISHSSYELYTKKDVDHKGNLKLTLKTPFLKYNHSNGNILNDKFIYYPTPIATWCILDNDVEDEDSNNILKSKASDIKNAIFGTDSAIQTELLENITDKGMYINYEDKDIHPSYFIPGTNYIDKEHVFNGEVTSKGFGVITLDKPGDSFINKLNKTKINTSNIYKDTPPKLLKLINKRNRVDDYIMTSEIIDILGGGLYIFMSCADLRLYLDSGKGDDRIIDYHRHLPHLPTNILYYEIFEKINRYNENSMKLWNHMCKDIDIDFRNSKYIDIIISIMWRDDTELEECSARNARVKPPNVLTRNISKLRDEALKKFKIIDGRTWCRSKNK